VLDKLLGSKFKHSLVRSGSPMFVKNIVHRSNFIGLVRQDSVSIELRNKLLVELSLASQVNVSALFPPQKVGIIFRKEAPPSPGSVALIAQLKQSTSPNTQRIENPFLPATEL